MTGVHLQNVADKNRQEKELVDTITDTKMFVSNVMDVQKTHKIARKNLEKPVLVIILLKS